MWDPEGKVVATNPEATAAYKPPEMPDHLDEAGARVLTRMLEQTDETLQKIPSDESHGLLRIAY